MNALIWKTIKENMLGIGMQILEIPARVCFRKVSRPETAQNCGAHIFKDLKFKIHFILFRLSVSNLKILFYWRTKVKSFEVKNHVSELAFKMKPKYLKYVFYLIHLEILFKIC